MSWLRSVAAVSAGVALSPPQLERAAVDEPRAPALGPPPSAIVGQPGALTLRAPGSPMILVRRSVFVMGSTSDDVVATLVECQREPGGHRCEPTLFSNESPQRTVTLSAFWLDRAEVTVAEYARCAALGRCRALPLGEG